MQTFVLLQRNDSAELQWLFHVQRELPGDMLFAVNYQESKATHLFRFAPDNSGGHPDDPRVPALGCGRGLACGGIRTFRFNSFMAGALLGMEVGAVGSCNSP